MKTICLVYHDLVKEKKHGLSEGDTLTDESLVVKEMVIPGMLDYPPMYIRHLNLMFKGKRYFIISMTDYELDETKKQEIINGAEQFVKQLN
ncbi:hypothetical protein NIES37_62750 [Tolypothrix tenuis PCC 7101]|uniref:Uncharacterized protein n=1 Tax=Tolypothrix tenuis PCC 7101 TaxID=231146 RepID=A0A1Z4N957_9CYAN|nr:hypothetical protein [Aulosira sp. FACHB-113]BAZ02263.1 hypothetical protein NIES37_62750 [Tolypothrix tenuis PCC 7101]BAZ73816.1 hypothetical protein NIES50_23820 [Aulosira laxa NIES-50]